MPHRNNDERERSVFSASSVLDEIGTALTTIRTEDKITFADMAAILGKSEDQAAKYCAGSQEMGVVAFARAQREWNGRFSGGLTRLCHDSRPSKDVDRIRGSKVLKAALALSVALEDDDEITPKEVKQNRAAIEQARDALDELLRKLAPVEVRK